MILSILSDGIVDVFVDCVVGDQVPVTHEPRRELQDSELGLIVVDGAPVPGIEDVVRGISEIDGLSCPHLEQDAVGVKTSIEIGLAGYQFVGSSKSNESASGIIKLMCVLRTYYEFLAGEDRVHGDEFREL